MKTLVFCLAFSLIGLSVVAQDVVQISTERDAAGKFANWVDLVVTWGTEIVPDVPDHVATDDDKLQEWYAPVKGGYKLFSFERTQAGEYAIRWSHDGTIWSDPEVCEIVKPKKPRHAD